MVFNYILDENRNPVPEEDIVKWAMWFEKVDRGVATWIQGEIVVSTVFLGMNHSLTAHQPVLFETMVFGGEHDGYTERYRTWDEAERGHWDTVRRIGGKVCLFLDDRPERTPAVVANGVYPVEARVAYRKNWWCIVRSFEEFTNWILNNGLPDMVSFDHDLGDVHHYKDDSRLIVPAGEEEFDYDAYLNKEKTGLHAAKWLVEFCDYEKLPLPECSVHSANPTGAKNIKEYLANAKKHLKL